MKVFELHVELPTGAVLVGGYSALPVGASSAHARDGAGRPLIPATALRGALRESLEALLRGAGMPACEAGTGISPCERGARDGDRAPRPCIVDGGGRCVACRLFGSQRKAREAGERGFSALILGDAHLGSADADHEHWVERQQVARATCSRAWCPICTAAG